MVATEQHSNIAATFSETQVTWKTHYADFRMKWIEYDPFGGLISAAGAESTNNHFRFSTKYFDEETGLGYWGYRYYSPGLGRWISPDPIGEQGGLNLYAFVGNEPVNLFDSLGQAPESNDPFSCLDCYQYVGDEMPGTMNEQTCCSGEVYDSTTHCCEDGCVVARVSIWICNRKLGGQSGSYPRIGPISHSFVACDDPATTPIDQIRAFGKQPRPLDEPGSRFWGRGYIAREQFWYEPGNFDHCKERNLCPQEKAEKCREGPAWERYFLFSPFHNCHAWANGGCQ